MQSEQRRISRDLCHLFLVLLASCHSCRCSLNIYDLYRSDAPTRRQSSGSTRPECCYRNLTKNVKSVGSKFPGTDVSGALTSPENAALRVNLDEWDSPIKLGCGLARSYGAHKTSASSPREDFHSLLSSFYKTDDDTPSSVSYSECLQFHRGGVIILQKLTGKKATRPPRRGTKVWSKNKKRDQCGLVCPADYKTLVPFTNWHLSLK